MGNHGTSFSGRATIGFEPTFYRVHKIRFAEFPYLKVTASLSACGTLLRQLVSRREIEGPTRVKGSLKLETPIL
jgi:hypothetical protein